jgi:hypothetical protein
VDLLTRERLSEPGPGGQCRYRMTGPEDMKIHGWWRFDSIDAPPTRPDRGQAC